MQEHDQPGTPDDIGFQRVQGPTIPLMDRQRQILILLARGAENNEIADELGIAYQTVKNYLLDAQNKLLERNSLGSVTRALIIGEITPEDINPSE